MRRLVLFIAALALSLPSLAWADSRKLVEMPPMMRDHMLANMRDHLRSLDLILEALSKGDSKGAAELAESKLGMSSLDAHGAEHMAPMMPLTMREIGTALHHAASRFAVTVRDAELEPPDKAARQTFAALREMTAACEACHSLYRLR
ncbi:hypothetical protein CU669_15965 [Paramagnetospirillum kuznetsovii]|uniref:Cytochrome C n=1 Tax=Paramagnetospirillum kuznetsovii TaxID=2053833 RepID=A0A364NV19_9PROT|nr:hypothetical protein [Paramagnetospirillum kuznetsovii]RAU20924.1 hypothetical protein CU669_15965 [Paramagnetospirillum kuznetsovii]